MLYAVLNKSLKQHPTKQQLYGHLPPISQTLHVGQAGEVKMNLFVTVSYELQNTDMPVLANQQRLNIHQLCEDTRSLLENIPRVMTNRDEW